VNIIYNNDMTRLIFEPKIVDEPPEDFVGDVIEGLETAEDDCDGTVKLNAEVGIVDGSVEPVRVDEGTNNGVDPAEGEVNVVPVELVVTAVVVALT
jgi:hypothetical protein